MKNFYKALLLPIFFVQGLLSAGESFPLESNAVNYQIFCRAIEYVSCRITGVGIPLLIFDELKCGMVDTFTLQQKFELVQRAIEYGNKDVIKAMLSSFGINTRWFNIIDLHTGNTALHVAAAMPGGADILELLLQCGQTNPKIINKDGKTALELAANSDARSYDLLKRALHRYDDKILFRQAVIDADEVQINSFLDSGLDIETFGIGPTPLVTAIKENDFKFDNQETHYAVIKLLLDRGANINGTNIFWIPLLQAVLRPNFDRIIALLAQSGANVNVQDVAGNSPLHIISEFRGAQSIPGITLLCNHGADPRIRNVHRLLPEDMENCDTASLEIFDKVVNHLDYVDQLVALGDHFHDPFKRCIMEYVYQKPR